MPDCSQITGGAYERLCLSQLHLLPYDCDLGDLPNTAIAGNKMTALLSEIQAGRLLVLFDACHSGGAGNPKGILTQFKGGLGETYYQALAQVNASQHPIFKATAMEDGFPIAVCGGSQKVMTMTA